jgi:hypothetical protein
MASFRFRQRQVADPRAQENFEQLESLVVGPAPLALASGFSAWQATDTPSYRRDLAGVVYLQGRVKNANLVNNDTFTLVATLPSNLRPVPLQGQTAINHIFSSAIFKNPGNVVGFALVDELGQIQVLCPGANIAVAGYASLDGVAFPTL